MARHVIHLRGPWQFLTHRSSGESHASKGELGIGLSTNNLSSAISLQATRNFHRPTGLSADQRLSLAIETTGDLRERVRLNSTPLHFADAGDHFQISDIKRLLRPDNVLVLEWSAENCCGTWPPPAPSSVELWIDD